MFLKPPRGSDKPKSSRTNNCAFTNRPLPKRTAFKPPEEQESKAQKQDTPLVIWTRANKSDCNPVFRDVLSYVLDGPPYKGDVKFGFKDEVKGLGAQWLRNPQSEEGEPSEDKKGQTIKRGWWAAWDDKTLFSLLNINKPSDTILWRAHGEGGALVDGECSVLKTWVEEFYLDVHGLEEKLKVVAHSEKIVSMLNEDREYNTVGQMGQEWSEPSTSSKPFQLKVPNIKYRQWSGDTSCSVCSVTVSDQFLDCRCEGAEWKRCSVCWLQWRCDAAATANTSCGCEVQL